MDQKNAIEVRNLTKIFKIEVEDKEKKASIIKKNPMKIVENKVIDGISFDIRKGEVVGILGRNGSGKSTLLSILAKIMEPDCGTVERSGKIASILELGMGFHPDMSGRENIYLKGELYGFSRKEIDERVSKIIEYSGIGDYIDNPVRTYSSGMSGRLAFAIMVNVDSDVMLVDEVLSVGDAAFSSKASMHFKKLASKGRTIIIVSHSITMLEEMCTRAIWIDNGKIKKDGPAKIICAEYQNTVNESPEIVFDLAMNGVAEAQYKLAIMYRDGRYYGQSDELYKEWVKQAAIQGHTRAQVEYGDVLLEQGDSINALGFYQSAANKGDNEARGKLSSLNSSRSEDVQALLNIFSKLATLGDPVNEYRYADLMLKTAWNNSDRKKAFDMFIKSAEHGYPNAIHQVGVMYKDGIGVARDISKMEEYLVSAANKGYLPSISLLADIYSQGKVLPKDDTKTFEYTKKASELGNVVFMYRLAMMYKDGIGVEKDSLKADEWFENYTSAGLFQYKNWVMPYVRTGFVNDHDDYVKMLRSTVVNCNVIYLGELTNCLLIGNEIDDSIINKMEVLANSGNVEACRRLGNYYSTGINKDLKKALEYFCKASDYGDVWSSNKVGEMYRDGWGITQDYNKAKQYFELSARSGNTIAVSNLISLKMDHDDIDNSMIGGCIEILS